MTNADKIRRMDNAELFRFINDVMMDRFVYCMPQWIKPGPGEDVTCTRESETCDECLKEWLASEVGERDNSVEDADLYVPDEKYLIGADAIVCISDYSLELFKAMPLFSFLMTCNSEGVMLTADDLATIRGYYAGLEAQNKALHMTAGYDPEKPEEHDEGI